MMKKSFFAGSRMVSRFLDAEKNGTIFSREFNGIKTFDLLSIACV